MSSVQMPESTRPATASPRPPWPDFLIWFSATNPKMKPNRRPPMIPKISAAIAKPFVPGLAGGRPG